MKTTLVIVERHDQALELAKTLAPGHHVVSLFDEPGSGTRFDNLLLLVNLHTTDERNWYYASIMTRLKPGREASWFV